MDAITVGLYNHHQHLILTQHTYALHLEIRKIKTFNYTYLHHRILSQYRQFDNNLALLIIYYHTFCGCYMAVIFSIRVSSRPVIWDVEKENIEN